MYQRSVYEASEKFLSGYDHPLMKEGVTERCLAIQLKRELEATKLVRVKLRGKVDETTLAPGWKIVSVSDEETVLEFREELWNIQQQARQDAQKLLDLYPAERHEVDIDKEITVVIREFKDSEPDEVKTSNDKPKQ